MLTELTYPFYDFLFPSFCIHCDEPIAQNKLLCPSCGEHLVLLDPSRRCSRCFQPSEKKLCQECYYQKEPSFFSQAFSCEKIGPALSLASSLHTPCKEEIVKLLSSLLTVQLCRLPWPFPSFLVPWPDPKGMGAGMAKKMQELLEVPSIPLVSLRSSVWQEEKFVWKKRACISDLPLIVISLTMPKKEELLSFMSFLGQGDPSFIGFLSFI